MPRLAMTAVLKTAVLLAALMPVSGYAGEIVDAATQAESAIASGEPAKAYEALNSALSKAWEKIPLVIHKSLFVASDPQGYGIYDRRDTNEFKADQPLVVYCEPVGYGFGRDGELHTINMELDFVVKTASGDELGGQKSFNKWQLKSRAPNREFMGLITYTFNGIEPGDYIVSTTVRDLNSEESTVFDLPFKIVP